MILTRIAFSLARMHATLKNEKLTEIDFYTL